MKQDYNPFVLTDKTILVTGASSGIGKATAIEAAKLGAKVIVSGRNLKRLNETFNLLKGKGHLIIEADLTDENSITNLSAEIPDLNGLVLSVGVADSVPITFATKKKFKKVFDSNLFSPIELLRVLLKKKKIQTNGSIVALASVGGISVTSFANGIYGASKAALSSWIKFVAQELASKGIRANCVCPGMTETPFIHSGIITEDQLEKDKELYPLKRYGSPQEVAWSIIYLLSDASQWVTGSNLFIDGGISI